MEGLDEESKQKLMKELETISDRVQYAMSHGIQGIMRDEKVLEKEGAPGPKQARLFEIFLESMMKDAVNPEKFDNMASKSGRFKEPFTFYQNFESLLRRARAKDKGQFDRLVASFLSTNAIDYLSNQMRPGSTRITLLNARVKEIKKKVGEASKYADSMKNLIDEIDEIRQEAKELEETNVDTRQAEMELHVRDIIANYESTRYLVGVMIGLFDILSGTFNDHNNPYLNLNNSVGDIYYDSKRNRDKIKRSSLEKRELIPQRNLQAFLKENTNTSRFPAFKPWFEDWFFPTFTNIRIHPAHHQNDIQQDRISVDAYQIMSKDGVKSYSLAELKELKTTSYDFLVWAKSTAAYIFYTDNKERVQYLTRHDFENPDMAK